MAQHYFTIDELELAKEMNKDYNLKCDGLGAWGEKTGKVYDIGNENDNAELDPELFNDFFIDDDNKLEALHEQNSWYISELVETFDINIKDFVNPDELVIFNCRASQSEQNCLTWEQCIGELYCDEDDYDEFVEEHEEFQTKEWKVQKALKMLKEMGLTVEDLKEEA